MEIELTSVKQEPLMIKEEVESDIEEEVQCRLCHKSFASPIALRNHASMDHIEAFETGDPDIWTKQQEDTYIKTTKKVKRKAEVISALSSNVAGNKVSYIIVKSESPLAAATKKSSKKEKEPKKIPVQKKRKVYEPITGPFECVEPSPLGADGTCHQIFFSCCEYSLHSRQDHAKRRRAPRCQVCERVLPVRRGDSQTPFACETCGACFANETELETHMSKAHVKIKPYECGVCHKRFTQQGGVLQHMRMHTGERPFPCWACDKAFTQKSGLDQHVRTHTKNKPYRCVVCSKTFTQSVHLRQHMRTHTNVSPFQCGICEKRFKQSSHLNYHLKNHNPANMTDDQRAVYELLVGQITRDTAEPEPEPDPSEMFSGEVEVEFEESGQETYIIEQCEDSLQYD